MSNIYKKILRCAVLLFFVCTISYAIESEYKNSLEQVEFTKTSDDSYSVNLYTQKHYSEPVRVIKKSDLSYYILLPETKNSSNASFSSSDIRNVSATTYPYAAADIENGYTKININTTKPINFTVNTQLKSANSIAASTQKKNIQQNTSKPSSQEKVAQAQPKQDKPAVVSSNTQAKNTSNQTVPNLKLAPKIDTKKQDKTSVAPQKTSTAKTEVKKETPKNIVVNIPTAKKQETKKVNTQSVEPKKSETSSPAPKQPVKQQPVQKPIVQQPAPVESIQLAPAVVEPKVENSQTVEDVALQNQQEIVDIEEAPTEELAEEVVEETVSVETLPASRKSFGYIMSRIKSKLDDYGLSFVDLALILLTLGICLVIIFLLATKRPNSKIRIKKKAELIMGKNETSSFVPKEPVQSVESDVDNTETNADYTLSPYGVDENARASIDETVSNSGDYEIIQKILNDDSSEAQVEQANEEVVQPQEEEIPDPVMLSKADFAPERGFMCVYYNDSVRLVGYMFDDVFALYNFKVPELDDYTIKFRLASKDESGSNYIVKVGTVKLVVKVSGSTMKFGVLM